MIAGSSTLSAIPCAAHSRRTRVAIPSASRTGSTKPTSPGAAGCCGFRADSSRTGRRHFVTVR
jgi:hypothetical protein